MHRRVPSARCTATRGAGSRSLTRRLVFPLARPAALLGFWPFAVLSHIGWNDISAIPGPPAVRASAPAPIDFRRGDSASIVSIWLQIETDGVNLELVAFDFWASLPSAGAPAVVIAAGRDPAMGFASCRVCGHLLGAFVRARPRTNHPPPRCCVLSTLSSAIRSWASMILPERRTRRRVNTDPRPMPVTVERC